MSRWYGGWAPYVPVAERRRKAERAMAKRRKAGHPVSPVIVTGRAIATTFWGKAWCDNLESYRDYENRLPRGRTYVRNGSVVDLQIAPGRVAAVVSGSELYEVTISVKETPKTQWRAMCSDCAGGIDSLVELLQGRLSKAVMERLCRQQGGLFPRPSEIRFSCSCPDYAVMCKHVAAVLYGVGARLDHAARVAVPAARGGRGRTGGQAGTGLRVAEAGPGFRRGCCRWMTSPRCSASIWRRLRQRPRRKREAPPRQRSRRAGGRRRLLRYPGRRPRRRARPRGRARPVLPPRRKHRGRASPRAPRATARNRPARARARGGRISAARTKQNGAVPTKSGRAATARTVAAKPVGAAGGKQKPVRWW